jgi:hypothetical protein
LSENEDGDHRARSPHPREAEAMSISVALSTRPRSQADRVARQRHHSKAAPSMPKQLTEEVAMTTDSPMHSWIRFWLKRNDHEFEKNAEWTRELDQTVIETDLRPSVREMLAQLTLERHQRNQFPVGAYFDLIDSRRHDGQQASVEQLMMVAEIGADLFFAAICVADDNDNEELFVEAYEHWGPLIDTVLQECDREDRDSFTGRRLRSSTGAHDDRHA